MKIIIYCVVAFFVSNVAHLSASTLVEVEFEQVVNESQVIVHAAVINKQAWRHSDSGRIFTKYSLEVKDVLAGEIDEKVLFLNFMGGSLAGEELHVTGSVLPEVGDEGVYFIENTGELLLNPLVGWNSGHFRVSSQVLGEPINSGSVNTGLSVKRVDDSLHQKVSEDTGFTSHSIAPAGDLADFKLQVKKTRSAGGVK